MYQNYLVMDTLLIFSGFIAIINSYNIAFTSITCPSSSSLKQVT